MGKSKTPIITIMDYSAVPTATSPHYTDKPLPPPPEQHEQPEGAVDKFLFGRSKKQRYFRRGLIVSIAVIVLWSSYSFLFNRIASLTLAGSAPGGKEKSHASEQQQHSEEVSKASKTHIPQYFQTSPELWPGPTATGRAPFLAATNPVTFASTQTFAANEPLETGEPIVGQKPGDESIFRKMGHLSGYFPNPEGFGVDEFRIRPELGEKISMVQMLSRHGSRYPTSGLNVQVFAERIKEARGTFDAKGQLKFLKDWEYALGAEILVPKGRQELFDSGVLHYYMYGQLYDPNGGKIIARTTTQDRMLKSAQNFMAGFFGLEWTNNATLELVIEANGFNNSLAGYKNCPNSVNFRNTGGLNATQVWKEIYLKPATTRLQSLIKNYNWTIEDSYAAQSLCPYETVAYGYSSFCSLFTYEEWDHFEYAQDLWFAGVSGFQSPTGRAVGLGYVQETVARLKNHTLGYSGSNINTTLDGMEETFPLNQKLYFDFSHDTNIMSILTAFGFKQFNEVLDPKVYPGRHNLTVSRMEPFAARLDIEIIKTPYPVDAITREMVMTTTDNDWKRHDSRDEGEKEGGNEEEVTYIHFILNQRTLPLGVSFPECDEDGKRRRDGWCKLETFLRLMETKTEEARFEDACFGEWDVVPYGEIKDGRPL